jgi:hypothetical protein
MEEVRVRLENPTDEPWYLEDLQKGCSCQHVEVPFGQESLQIGQEVAAHGAVEFPVKFEIKEMMGVKEGVSSSIAFDLEFNNGEVRKKVVIDFMAVPWVVMRAEDVAPWEVSRGDEAVRVMRVEAVKGESLKITGVEGIDKDRFESMDLVELEGAYEVMLKLNTHEVREVGQSGIRMMIETQGEKILKEVRWRMGVAGHVVAEPKQWDLGALSGVGEREMVWTLRSVGEGLGEVKVRDEQVGHFMKYTLERVNDREVRVKLSARLQGLKDQLHPRSLYVRKLWVDTGIQGEKPLELLVSGMVD